jgi:hypothetical protein
MAFCDVNIPSPEMMATWNAMCDPEAGPAYLIDVGDKKYHKSAGSAAEVEKMASDTTEGRTFNYLVELVNENNRTGKLKSYRHSVAKMIRDFYELPGGLLGPSQEFIFDHGMDVVNGFFLRPNDRAWADLFEKPEYADLRKLWDGFNVSEKEVLPFTLPLYFRQLFLAGRSPAEITEKITWWINKARQVETLKATAKLKVYNVTRFANGSKQFGYVKVGGTFESEAFSYLWVGSGRLAVAIIRNERGHVQIRSSFKHPGANFDALAATLDNLEPGRWYHEGRFSGGNVQMLMNGSPQFTGVTPTALSDDELIMLVREYVTFGGK